ncbi:uncharacterized protein LOC128643987 [Bombina bombina]|uniref:uncharacterized protein LOC128643987 n=1 Tax=Bombina bombina TaxID=8345 RepID=UPI00235B20CB|nr:uncharacterized protein LOC128643987 [Bombina bombina]
MIGSTAQINSEILRYKLANLASHAATGLDTQYGINNNIANLQQHQTYVMVDITNIIKNKFNVLVNELYNFTHETAWAMLCSQVQSDLSTDLKIQLQSLWSGKWPASLSLAASKSVTNFAMTHLLWWEVILSDCTTEFCMIHTLIPWSGKDTIIYRLATIGLPANGSLLFPVLSHQWVSHNIDESKWTLVDVSLCHSNANSFICSLSQFHSTNETCWENQKSCTLQSHFNVLRPVFYLGSDRVCFHLFNSDTIIFQTQDNVFASSHLLPGTWCNTIPLKYIASSNWNFTMPQTLNITLNLTWDHVMNFSVYNLPLGMGSQMKKWLTDSTIISSLLQNLKHISVDTKITVEHEQGIFKSATSSILQDANISWWESVFGYRYSYLSLFLVSGWNSFDLHLGSSELICLTTTGHAEAL